MADNVLVVDDNPTVLDVLSVILEEAGYKPQLYQKNSNSFALSDCLGDDDPDLILLDVMMPGHNGYELCKIFKADKRTADVPVMFMSAEHSVNKKVKGLELGGVDFITKPFDPAELIARVRNQINTRRAAIELRESNKELTVKQDTLSESLHKAAAIQQSFLPPNVCDLNNLNVAWKFLPHSDVSGDIFNIVRYTDNEIGIYMLDVSGHGLPEALVSTAISQILQPNSDLVVTRGTTSDSAEEVIGPELVLQALNNEFPLERFDKYFTIVYMILDTETGLLKYSNAGHPPPVILRVNGAVELLDEGGCVIGVTNQSYKSYNKRLSPGDKLILYTDGVTELAGSDGELFGPKRLYSMLKAHRRHPIEQILEQAIRSLKRYRGNSAPTDDISLLALEYTKNER